MKKKWMGSLICMILLVAFISFIARFFKEDDRPKVVVVLKTLDKEYWRIFKAGTEKAFHDFDIDGKVIAPDSAYPITKQLNMLKAVVKENPDALIVTPSNPSLTIPVLEEFKQKNIPVLLADTDFKWTDKTAYIGTDNLELGKKAGALLGSMLQPGDQVALIGGNSDDPVFNDRIKGAKQTLEDAGIEIAAEQSGYDDTGHVKSVMENILQTYPDIKGVIAVNDLIALDALKIIEKQGTKIPVIGADGITEMVKYIEKGILDATVAQNPYDMGYLSVKQALKAIKGEAVEKRIDSGIDLITQDNAKDKLDFLANAVNLR
ncbi:sugar ABC transporter substrate-binding protein [Ectobacillus funiculus]|uniref:Sugar ABC transporter substrate-binding protein n=1 Tax=Ectobacillus funiculus TaxID=137993 RepID=A0ABV5WEI0_9BACI